MQGSVISCVLLLAQFHHNLASFYNIKEADEYYKDSMSIAPRVGLTLLDTNQYWPNGTVPYKFAGNFDDGHKHLIRVVFNEFRSYCINFQEMHVNDDWTKDYVRIIYNTQRARCFADTGRLGGQQYMTYSDKECFRLHVIRHQVLHTLGFYHEHQRPDRDCFILFQSQFDLNQETLSKNANLSTHFPYDIHSILHYGKYYVEQFKQLTTWQTWAQTPHIRLTELDKFIVRHIYCSNPVGKGNNNEYTREKWCKDNKAMCDEDDQIRTDCGYGVYDWVPIVPNRTLN